MQHLQAFPAAIDECLEERFVVGDGLQDVPISSDIAYGPLAQARAAQPKDVTTQTERQREKQEPNYSSNTKLIPSLLMLR